MASTEGLVPITRNFLSSYYDKYPFSPLSDEVSLLSSQIRSLANDLLQDSPPSQGSLSVSLFKDFFLFEYVALYVTAKYLYLLRFPPL